MIATNLLGPIRLTAALLPVLLADPRAAIMTVSSGLAFVPMAMTPTYCATKADMHSYTQSLRSSLLIPDYRGYGKSEGKPSEAGLYLDAEAAYRWLIGQVNDPGQLIIQGESLGSAVAVDLASRHPCAGVVLEAPFNSASRVAAGILPLLGHLIVSGFDSKAKIGKIHAPLLFIHGDRDEVIHYELDRDLAAAAPEPKTFWTVSGAGHNDLIHVAGAQYGERLAAFYASLR